MPDKKVEKERYYITDSFASSEVCLTTPGEKMEPGWIPSYRLHGETSLMTRINGKILLQYVEEEVSYMADYEADENGEIKSVHFDPVPLGRKKWAAIITDTEGEFPDTL